MTKEVDVMARKMIEEKFVIVYAAGTGTRRGGRKFDTHGEARRAMKDARNAVRVERVNVVNYSTIPATRAAQLRHESNALAHIQSANAEGECYRPIIDSVRNYHARDRLEAKGLIVWVRIGWCGGWVARGFVVRRRRFYRVRPMRRDRLDAWARREHWGEPGFYGPERPVVVPSRRRDREGW